MWEHREGICLAELHSGGVSKRKKILVFTVISPCGTGRDTSGYLPSLS